MRRTQSHADLMCGLALLSSSKLCTAVHEWQNSIAMHVLTLVLHVYDFILKIRGSVFADHPVDSAATA